MSSETYQSDWDNREFTQNIQYNIMQITSFLNKFYLDVNGRIASINQKLTVLERQVEYIHASVDGFNSRSLTTVEDEEAVAETN